MARPLIVANWKMNTTLADAMVLAGAVKRAASDIDGEIVLCPPFTWLVPLAESLEHASNNLHLGAQNMWFAEKGPMTGEISPLMLENLVRYVIVGHSERRLHFHETDELINDKLHAALDHHLQPIVCIGELKKMQFEKKSRGRPDQITLKSDIIHQLKAALEGVSREKVEKVVITFEPVWAISRGTAASRNAATGGYANFVIGELRAVLREKYGQAISERMRILYGGSVDENNIQEFMFQPEIDGVLVGGASLNAREFIAICKGAEKD